MNQSLRTLSSSCGWIVPLLMTLLLGTGPAAAQTARLRGLVTDGSDGQPLQGVNVVVQDPAGLFFGAATDTDGFYTLSRLPPGRYFFQASFIGFTTVRDTLVLAPGEIRTYNLVLEPDATALEEVVVEAEDEGGAARVIAGLQSIRPKDIALIPTPDVSGDLVSYLAAMPGVVTSGDRGGQFFIRGGEPSHTLTQIDGMYVYQPFHVLGFYSAFPSDVLSGVDVYAGGFGSRFSGRISSVIDIHTRTGNKKAFQPTVALSPFISSTLLEGPLLRDRISFLGSARVSMVERIASRYINEPLPYVFGDYFGKVHALLSDNHQVSFSTLQTYDRGTLEQDPTARTPEEIRWKNTAYGFRYLILPRQYPIQGEVIISTSRLETEMGPQEQPSRSSTLSSFNLAVNINEYLGRSEVGWGFFMRVPSPSAVLGGQFQNVELSTGSSPNPGAYVEPDFYLGGGLRVRPGLVGHLVGNNGFFFEPRLRIVWARGAHQVSGAAGLYRQDIVGLTDRRDVTNVFTAWTDTPPGPLPKALHALLGYQVAPTPWLTLSAEGYYKDLEGLYISEWTAFPRFTTRMQPASGRVRGADLRLEVRHPAFYGFLNYGLSSVEYTATQPALQVWFGTSEITFRPPHDRRHQVNLLLSTSQLGFDVSLHWNFGSGLPFTQVRGFDGFIFMNGPVDVAQIPGRSRVIYDRPFGGVLPTFHRLDLSVERSFPVARKSQLTVLATLINAYDRANLFALDLFTLRRTNQLPILPTLGLKIEVL